MKTKATELGEVRNDSAETEGSAETKDPRSGRVTIAKIEDIDGRFITVTGPRGMDMNERSEIRYALAGAFLRSENELQDAIEVVWNNYGDRPESEILQRVMLLVGRPVTEQQYRRSIDAHGMDDPKMFKELQDILNGERLQDILNGERH